MAETPWRTLEWVKSLDQDELLEGYRDGLDREPEPGDNQSDAYRWGYENGKIDRGDMEPTYDRIMIAREIRLGSR